MVMKSQQTPLIGWILSWMHWKKHACRTRQPYTYYIELLMSLALRRDQVSNLQKKH